MRIKIRNPFAHRSGSDLQSNDNELVIERDSLASSLIQAEGVQQLKEESDEKTSKKDRKSFSRLFHQHNRQKMELAKEGSKNTDEFEVHQRNSFERFAFNLLSSRLPGFDEFRESYNQSGIPVIFEAYVSTGFLLSFVVAISTFIVSFLLELRLIAHFSAIIPIIGSLVLSGVALAITLFSWLAYPLIRRRSFKSKLENQLAYSFGILGVLAAAGMNLERLFERIATSESNPVMADLAKRFLRNIRLFGLDTETALSEVAQHSPSEAFSKMLGSVAVAYKTTGSIHDLVMFESARLLQEKRDKLRKTIGSLAVMAELYITVVVVGPIIFIVMMAIFGLLPAGGLPNPISIINLIVFVGIPVLSVMFVLLLDSVVSKA